MSEQVWVCRYDTVSGRVMTQVLLTEAEKGAFLEVSPVSGNPRAELYVPAAQLEAVQLDLAETKEALKKSREAFSRACEDAKAGPLAIKLARARRRVEDLARAFELLAEMERGRRGLVRGPAVAAWTQAAAATRLVLQDDSDAMSTERLMVAAARSVLDALSNDEEGHETRAAVGMLEGLVRAHEQLEPQEATEEGAPPVAATAARRAQNSSEGPPRVTPKQAP